VLKYVCVTTEPANQLVLLSSVNNSLHVLQCKMNSRCYPPCKSCWSNYTYTWYERLSPGVSEASVIDGVTSESFNLAVTLPDGRGYYCSTTVAGTGTVGVYSSCFMLLLMVVVLTVHLILILDLISKDQIIIPIIYHVPDHHKISGQRDYVSQGLRDSSNIPPVVYVFKLSYEIISKTLGFV
jgi:hypothetical protein